MKVEMPKDQLRLLNRATLMPIILIFVLATLLISIQNHILKINHLLGVTDDTLRHARVTHQLISTMESNYNSYVVTRRKEFLQNYLMARNDLPENLSRLEFLARETEGTKQFKEISRAFKSWVLHSESLFGRPFSEGVKVFESSDFQRVGNMYIDQIHNAFDTFITSQLKERDAQLKQTVRVRRTMISVGSILFVLVAAFLAWFFRRRLQTEFLKYEAQARHLRESREELQISLLRRDEALKSRDEFIKIASHELNTPLQSLLLQAQMLKRGVDQNNPLSAPRVSGYLAREISQINRLTGLVQDMLEITKMGKGVLRLQRSRMSLSELVHQVVADLDEIVSASQSELQLDLDDSIQGNWDQKRLGQVLSNLLTNALKYGRGRPVMIRSHQEGYWARIEIEDQGMGIPPESRNRIFERFERNISPSEVSGLGVGLYISREVVNSHGGKIWAESSGANLGSLFVVELPLSEEGRPGAEDLPGYLGSADFPYAQRIDQ